MKCPKCHYLSFEPAPRCRNCGFDLAMAESGLAISLTDDEAAAPAPDPDLRHRRRATARRAPKTLGLIHSARDSAPSEAATVAVMAPPAPPAAGTADVADQVLLHDRFREAAPAAFDDVPLRPEPESFRPDPPRPDAPRLDPPRVDPVRRTNTPGELPLFVKGIPAQAAPDLDDIALAALSRPSRPPLGVRRTMPELVRPRPASITPPRKLGPIDDDLIADLSRVEKEEGARARAAARAHARQERVATGEASAQSRVAALGADWGFLAAIAGLIFWASLRVAGVGASALTTPALVPLAAFLVMVAFGYFLLFTAAGGQTPGKMIAGIRVIDATGPRVQPPSLRQAAYRALLAAASGLILGAGFLTALGGRLALPDRVARTRTIRA
jgi:uncharacterized RDD family membrane protein YckC